MRFVKVIELPEGSSNPGIVPLNDFVREVAVKVENGGEPGGAATIFEQAQEPLQALPGDFWLTGD
jgi:hypothetical protein